MLAVKPVGAARKKPPAEVVEVLRLLAKNYFINDRHGMDIDALAQMPELDRIPKKMLRQWAAEDDWLNARARLLRDLRRDMEDSARRAMVGMQRQQLVDISEIHETAMDMLRDEMLQPKSWESVAGVAFKAQEAAAAIAQRLGEDVAADVAGPESTEADGAPMLPGPVAEMVSQNLTQEESMAAAHAVLNKRREHLLARLASQAKKTPNMTLGETPSAAQVLAQTPAPLAAPLPVPEQKPVPTPQIIQGPRIITQDAKTTGK